MAIKVEDLVAAGSIQGCIDRWQSLAEEAELDPFSPELCRAMLERIGTPSLRLSVEARDAIRKLGGPLLSLEDPELAGRLHVARWERIVGNRFPLVKRWCTALAWNNKKGMYRCNLCGARILFDKLGGHKSFHNEQGAEIPHEL